MKVLVTGARGFIGSHLVELLLKRNYEVRCVLRKKRTPNPWLDNKDIDIVEGDLGDIDSLEIAVKDVDRIFHLAGATKAIKKQDLFKSNFEGTANLLSATVKANPSIARFVHVSSLAVGGPSIDGRPIHEQDIPNPISEYGKSKLAAEQVVLEHASKIAITIVRPPAVYGPRDRDLLELFKYGKRGRRLAIIGGTENLSLIYVKDLAKGIVLAAENKQAIGKTYYLCNQQIYSAEVVGNLIASVMNQRARVLKIPLALVGLLSVIGEIYGKLFRKASVYNLDKYREISQKNWICDNSRAKKELGFETDFTLEKGLKETVNWYQKNSWL